MIIGEVDGSTATKHHLQKEGPELIVVNGVMGPLLTTRTRDPHGGAIGGCDTFFLVHIEEESLRIDVWKDKNISKLIKSVSSVGTIILNLKKLRHKPSQDAGHLD